MITKTQKAYRHGDICLVRVEKIPDGLKPQKTDTLLQNGSGGNPHKFKGGIFYPKQEGNFILGYLEAKNTKLYHREHGDKKIGQFKEAKIEDDTYEIKKQVEFTHEGMRPVID